ncbi:DUF4181 domain-containing protein [Oceanobacillus salinisoli]|uniref:DUF4181 domain-containing protein n=1 Tax=Oceanobacillus salinisoli TaxID=2678611 RepID=UPI0018CC133A
MKKLPKVDKKKFLSYNHVNEKHRKIDRTIQIAFMIVLVLGFIINVIAGPFRRVWFLEPCH